MDVEFINFLREKAKQLGEDAAYGGRMDDGGQRALEAQVDIYEDAKAGNVPAQWYNYLREYNRLTDPEYLQYLDLKKKFG